jgi:PAS domain S-box-containing protein
LKFKTEAVDLIITDLSMPNMNGTDFIKMIRDINQEVPIIIVSVYSDNESLMQSINYGIQGYIKKPINKDILEEQINHIKSQKYQKTFTKEFQDITNRSAIISKINKEGIITYVNETFCETSGFTKEELIGEQYNLIKSNSEGTQFLHELLSKLSESHEKWTGVLKHQNKSGELYYLKTTIQPISNKDDKTEQFITLSIPITDVVNPEEQLNDYLQQHQESVLLLIKIEEFKYLEHSFTQKITKKLQKLFAQELLKRIPLECGFSKVYLLDNGEFAFVKNYTHLIDTEKVSHKIQNFQQRVNQEKIKIGIIDYTLSIIVSLAYGKNTLQNAKIGLKRLLENKEEFIIAQDFMDEVTRTSNKKLNQFNMLKQAIDNYNIISYFQPIINNQTKKVEKYESLVRLIDQEKNILTPQHFLEVAKEGKYYHTITIIVLNNSFRALFNSDIEIAINLSALDMEDKRIKNEFFSLAERYRTQAHRITIEMVEDEKIKNQKNTLEFIRKVRSYGIKVAIDDFGEGLSNFGRIQTYQPDYIKIDGSLIRNIENDEFSKNMIETIVFFAKKQNIKTVAEYVENENIYNILTELGVDYSQGHYFSKAALLKEFIPSSL